LNQDLDNHLPAVVADTLAHGTGQLVDKLHAATHAAYAGLLYTTHNPIGRNPWLLPITVESLRRMRKGLQYCPACLSTDAKPYFRRVWRLAFVTSCTIHGTSLRDECPACGAILHPHRAQSLVTCWRCDQSLCAPALNVASHDHLSWQHALEASLQQGWMTLGDEPVRSHIGFAIIRQVAAIMINGRQATALRDAVARNLGGDPSPYEKPTARQPIEYLTLPERQRLFDLVGRVIRGWPAMFAHVCLEAGLLRAQAIRDMAEPPFAFDEVVTSFLTGPGYVSPEAEVAAAAAWLRKTTGKATYASLKELCGETRHSIYKYMDYERRPMKRSHYHNLASGSHSAIKGAQNTGN
jgi:hypothetical protein